MSDDGFKNGETIGEFSKGSLREIAKEIVMRRQGLKNHWIVYLSVNILLYVINTLFYPYYGWHMWALCGWGIGIALHTYKYIVFKQGAFVNGGKGAANHAVVYCIVSFFLLWVNVFTTPSIFWCVWPIGIWGFGFLVHLYVFLVGRPKKGDDPRKSYIERQVDKELEKLEKK